MSQGGEQRGDSHDQQPGCDTRPRLAEALQLAAGGAQQHRARQRDPLHEQRQQGEGGPASGIVRRQGEREHEGEQFGADHYDEHHPHAAEIRQRRRRLRRFVGHLGDDRGSYVHLLSPSVGADFRLAGSACYRRRVRKLHRGNSCSGGSWRGVYGTRGVLPARRRHHDTILGADSSVNAPQDPSADAIHAIGDTARVPLSILCAILAAEHHAMTDTTKSTDNSGPVALPGHRYHRRRLRRLGRLRPPLYRYDIRARSPMPACSARRPARTAEFAAMGGGCSASWATSTRHFAWLADSNVHMNIGTADRAHRRSGTKLHTGRSRNDRVATDLRLLLRQSIDDIAVALDRLRTVLDIAEREAATIMPGFTHLQVAQPVAFGHHMMAWFEMLTRDASRFVDCRRRVNVMPLGAAALAGTSYPLDRAYTAELLGFDAPAENSLDAVSDRDFAIEFCAAAALLITHLSRFSEELILWSSAQFDFIELSDSTAPASIMPQKKNPDVPNWCAARATHQRAI